MGGSKPAFQFGEHLAASRVFRMQALHHALPGQQPHLDGVVEHFALAVEERAVALRSNCHDTQIGVAAQPPVEAHLSLAVQPALRQGRVVEEAHVARLLELIDVFPGQEDVGDVRLDQLDAVDWMGIDRRR